MLAAPGERVVVPLGGDNGIDFNDAAPAGFGTDTATHPVEQTAAGIGYLLEVIETYRILVTHPLERHTGDIRPQYLMIHFQ